MGSRAHQYVADVLSDPALALDSTARQVLREVADYANVNGLAWVAHSTIGGRIGRHPDTVWRAVRRLVTAGVVDFDPGVGGRHRPGLYRFPIAAYLSTTPAPTRGFRRQKPPRQRHETPAPASQTPAPTRGEPYEPFEPSVPPWISAGLTFDQWRKRLA